MATVETAGQSSSPKNRPAPFRVQIGNDRLEYRDAVIEDPVPTGRQILELAGALPTREHIVFQMLQSGLLEELRDDETTDLRKGGAERFIVFKSDRTFRFELNDRRFDWGAAEISGIVLKKLADVDSGTHSVWLDVPQGDDRKIADDAAASLAASKTEQFYTSRNEIMLIVNLKEEPWGARRITYEQVTLLAFSNPPPGIVITYTVEYEGGPKSNPEGSMTMGDSVKVKDGMVFSVTETGRS
jgi:hypothetical protein